MKKVLLIISLAFASLSMNANNIALEVLEEFLDAHTENTVKYIIDKKLRWELRDILDQFNINERMIYPGKAGIAKWLARHYFVKRK